MRSSFSALPVKRVILDENLPRPLRYCFPSHDVVTVQYQGWSGIQNGELFDLIDGVFDVFLTADKNLRYQQNLQGRKTAIIELPFTRMDLLQPLVEQIEAAIYSATPGAYISRSNKRELSTLKKDR